MPDKFDPYRERLVVETKTIWPPDSRPDDPARVRQVEAAAHARPAEMGSLEYLRTHTGFCRIITLSPDELERLLAGHVESDSLSTHP